MNFEEQVKQALLALESGKLTKDHIEAIKQSVKSRKKQIKLYPLVTEALRPMYLEKIRKVRERIAIMEDDCAFYDCNLRKLKHQQEECSFQHVHLAAELANRRYFAEERQKKKSRREHQYNRAPNLPLISSNFEKKYVRARDKFLAAEKDLSEFAEAVDNNRQRKIKILRDMQSEEERIRSSQELLESLKSDIAACQDLLKLFDDGERFWLTFLHTNILSVIRLSGELHDAAQTKRGSEELSDVVEDFKTTCLDYINAEEYGTKQLIVDVDFCCARCDNMIHAWPMLDKVRTNQLLCEACYVRTRTSMIIEKKLMTLKLSDRRPAALQHRTSSTATLDSMSTTRSYLTIVPSADSTTAAKLKNLLKRSSKHKGLSSAV